MGQSLGCLESYLTSSSPNHPGTVSLWSLSLRTLLRILRKLSVKCKLSFYSRKNKIQYPGLTRHGRFNGFVNHSQREMIITWCYWFVGTIIKAGQGMIQGGFQGQGIGECLARAGIMLRMWRGILMGFDMRLPLTTTSKTFKNSSNGRKLQPTLSRHVTNGKQPGWALSVLSLFVLD